MSQIVAGVVLVLLVAFAVYAIANGMWRGVWAGSGMEESGRKFPGGPDRDPYLPSE